MKINDNHFIVFLDFDGVTHPRTGGEIFDEQCLSFISEGLKDFNCEIVISSSWREELCLDDMTLALKALDKPIIGVTPIIDDPFLKSVRHHEIIKFLDDNIETKTPKWIAIDDTTGFFKKNDPVFYVNGEIGFNQLDVASLGYFIKRIFKNEKNDAFYKSNK